MALEKWAAIASIGLFAMFSGEMISIYYFMTNIPADFEFATAFEANPKILQFISIGVAPASILAGLSFLMSRRYGSRPNGLMIIGGGIIMLVGMAICYSVVDQIPEQYITDSVRYVPILFMVLSAPVMIVGFVLFKIKKKRPKKEYF
ncbi:hypothetical protein NsoK4_05655 [Nitrosopumilus sp. K4]|uniref:hypothetical protein n=1 Tax=Nitrosopumilus sp. K4 TaxID=2795383 RepID=UPI001BA4532A|nr:hypothetical protein [Nitrosopumilus sp. K4]QUC63949.1 hypothetical protein NsoK4_05655 [Nitrosopumilus sp. K4]